MVKGGGSSPRGRGFDLARTTQLTQNRAAIILDRDVTWHCCKCCNPVNGRVDILELLHF